MTIRLHMSTLTASHARAQVALTSAALAASARHLAEFCKDVNDEYLKCKFDNNGMLPTCWSNNACIHIHGSHMSMHDVIPRRPVQVR